MKGEHNVGGGYDYSWASTSAVVGGWWVRKKWLPSSTHPLQTPPHKWYATNTAQMCVAMWCNIVARKQRIPAKLWQNCGSIVAELGQIWGRIVANLWLSAAEAGSNSPEGHLIPECNERFWRSTIYHVANRERGENGLLLDRYICWVGAWRGWGGSRTKPLLSPCCSDSMDSL